MPSRNLLIPNRLFKLIRNYSQPLDDVYFFDNKSCCHEIYYKKDGCIKRCETDEYFATRQEAEKRKDELEAIEKYSKIKAEKEEAEKKIKELEEQIEELKSLPPVEVETIRNIDDGDIYPADDPRSKFYKEKFDEKFKENLTENKKR